VLFTGPYLTRRVAQSVWEFSASVCSSSATSHVVCGLSGRVSLAAHVDEQRRKQAEARVSCSLPSFLWTSIRKKVAKGRKGILLQAKFAEGRERIYQAKSEELRFLCNPQTTTNTSNNNPLLIIITKCGCLDKLFTDIYLSAFIFD
jgi:hypothetical protein